MKLFGKANRPVRAPLTSRAVAMTLICTIAVTGCAVQPTGPGGTSTQTQAECITSYVVVGALVGAAAGALVANKDNRGRGAVTGAVAGGVAGYAAAWMGCINKFSKPTTEQAIAQDSLPEATGYNAQQGTLLTIRSAYIDPGAAAPGGNVRLRVAYSLLDAAKDVKVQETTSFKVVFADGKEISSPPSRDVETVEPGLRQVAVPLVVPEQVVDVKVIATLRLEANGRSQEVVREFYVTRDAGRLQLAQTEALRNRSEYEKLFAMRNQPAALAAARASAPAPTQVAIASGSKQVVASAKSMIVTINRANVRDQPSVKGNVVGTLAKGAVVALDAEVNGAEGKWFRIDFKGSPAWVGASAGKAE